MVFGLMTALFLLAVAVGLQTRAESEERNIVFSDRGNFTTRHITHPLTARIGGDGFIECMSDDYGECGVAGDVLTIDENGKRVWTQ